ncbi:hypothetical protein MW887_001095 [Aspergillus wentii]|nr:hypothetical protein MW887_001095 [Aspergillus wentii]
MSVLALNPFKNFEGHNSPLFERLESARHWIEIAACLQASYLQVPSQFDTANSSGNWSVMVNELQQLADLAASHSLGIAYEAVAWGSYIDTWEDCLGVRHEADSNLRASLDRFVQTCPLDKICYIQFSDGEKFSPPLSPQHRFYQAGFPPGLTWSRNMRPFPLETELGAYLPVVDIARTWLKQKGWKGVVSMEIFDWRMRDASRRPDENAKRGMRSWEKLVAALDEPL